jgi:hypothetical protein
LRNTGLLALLEGRLYQSTNARPMSILDVQTSMAERRFGNIWTELRTTGSDGWEKVRQIGPFAMGRDQSVGRTVASLQSSPSPHDSGILTFGWAARTPCTDSGRGPADRRWSPA